MTAPALQDARQDAVLTLAASTLGLWIGLGPKTCNARLIDKRITPISKLPSLHRSRGVKAATAASGRCYGSLRKLSLPLLPEKGR